MIKDMLGEYVKPDHVKAVGKKLNSGPEFLQARRLVTQTRPSTLDRVSRSSFWRMPALLTNC